MSETGSSAAATGRSSARSAGARPSRLPTRRGPSSSSTTTTAYGTANAGSSCWCVTVHEKMRPRPDDRLERRRERAACRAAMPGRMAPRAAVGATLQPQLAARGPRVELGVRSDRVRHDAQFGVGRRPVGASSIRSQHDEAAVAEVAPPGHAADLRVRAPVPRVRRRRAAGARLRPRGSCPTCDPATRGRRACSSGTRRRLRCARRARTRRPRRGRTTRALRAGAARRT